MMHRLVLVTGWLSWITFYTGAVPLAYMIIGSQLERNQPELLISNRFACDAIETGKEFEDFEAGMFADANVYESFDLAKCRIAGSGSAILYRLDEKPPKWGWIYANLSEDQIRETVGYRTSFRELSGDRWFYTCLVAAIWLFATLLLFILTGHFRIRVLGQ